MASARASSTTSAERSVTRQRCSVNVVTTLLSAALRPLLRRAARGLFPRFLHHHEQHKHHTSIASTSSRTTDDQHKQVLAVAAKAKSWKF